MAKKVWQEIKVHHCVRAGREVTLEAEVVYPAEFLPDTPPRVVSHRCSYGMECNLMDKPTCVWSGTNPLYDPFEE